MVNTYFNKKAKFNYKIISSIEAGIVLKGSEIKAIRKGRVDLSGSYVKIYNEEIFWIGGNINILEGDKSRSRKLLLHKNEISKLIGKVKERGFALIPMKLYIKKGKAKLEIGIGRGKRLHDKRELIKKREFERKEKTSY